MVAQKDTLIYRSGDVFLPSYIRKILNTYLIGNDSSLFYVNLWSLVHFGSGIAVGTLKITVLQAFVLHCIWELWQILIGMTHINARGVIDICVDTIFFMIGVQVWQSQMHRK